MTNPKPLPESAATAEDSSLKIYFRLLKYVVPYIGWFALSLLGFLLFALADRKSTRLNSSH